MPLNCSNGISAGTLMVFEIELSICRCTAACMTTWSSGDDKVCASTKTSGKVGRGEIGGALDRAEPFLDRSNRLRAAVANTAQHQRVGEAGDAEADAALLLRLLLLRWQWKTRDVDDVVHHADDIRDEARERLRVEP